MRRSTWLGVTVLLLVAVLTGCRGSLPVRLTAPKLTLKAGEAAQLELGMTPGIYHMVEVAAESVGEGGAEVVLGSGPVETPPMYFAAGTGKFDSRLWSPTWPAGEGGSLRIANYGPGSITFDRVKARSGGADSLYGDVIDRLPRAPAWSDLMDLQKKGEVAGTVASLPPPEMAGGRAWLNQQRRRTLFENIQGPPIPIRMAEPLRGNVQVRSCAMGASGAIVGFSRPNPTFWRALGPGWYPTPEAAAWRPLPRDKGMPRGFEIRQGALLRLAVYLADPKAETGTPGVVEARLFRLDTADPVVEAKFYDVGSEGKWFELAPDKPLGRGLYIIELRASRGSPMWLVWNREPEEIPGAEFPRANETLATENIDPEPDYVSPIDLQARVVGSASRIESLKGGESEVRSRSAGIERELVLRAQLAPGETEIYYIQGYRNPVPARVIDTLDAQGKKPDLGFWERTRLRMGF